MKADPELVESLRQAYSHPVSDEQAHAARMEVVRGAALTCLAVLAVGCYQWNRGPGRAGLIAPLMIAVSFGLNAVARYRAARPRPATPVPDDVLELAVREHGRCRACRTIVRKSAFLCPSCGEPSWLGPGFWVALAVGFTAVAAFAWWFLR